MDGMEARAVLRFQAISHDVKDVRDDEPHALDEAGANQQK